MLQYLLDDLHVFLALVLDIDKDVIEVYYYENVKFLCEDLVDIALKRNRCVGQSKRYDLVFVVALAGPENRPLFITFFDSHLMIGIGKIKLDETLSLAESI